MTDVKDDKAAAQVLVSADGKDWRDITSPLQSVEIEDHDTLTDQAKLVLDDNTGLLSHASFEGLLIRIGLGYGTKTPLIFEGLITGARIITQPDGQKVEITAHDFTFRMTKFTPNERVWKDGSKLSDAIKEVVMDQKGHPPYGLTIQDILPPEDTAFSEDRALSQRNVTDWDFLKLLAERNLSKVFVEFDGIDKSKFYFVGLERLATADPIGELTCCRGGGDLVSFSFEKVASGALRDVTASAVDFKTGETVTHKPQERPPRPETPPPATDGRKDVSDGQKKAIEALTELSAAAEKQIKAEQVQAAGATPDPDEAKAKAKLDPTRALGYRGSGVARGNTDLRAKSRITITGVSPWAVGDWYLRKVNHKYARSRIAEKFLTDFSSTFEATR
jgi:phage protein D